MSPYVAVGELISQSSFSGSGDQRRGESIESDPSSPSGKTRRRQGPGPRAEGNNHDGTKKQAPGDTGQSVCFQQDLCCHGVEQNQRRA